MAAAKAITPGGRREEAPAPAPSPSPVVPHLDDGVVSRILCRLPTKHAYRLAAVCRRWREMLSEPAFLSGHLSPRPLPLGDDGPYALILQPRRKIGYTHLTIVPTDPADHVHLDLDLPLDPKYSSKSRVVSKPDKNKPPTPCLFDTAADNFLLRTLFEDLEDNICPEDDDLDQLPAPGGGCGTTDDGVHHEDDDTASSAEDPSSDSDQVVVTGSAAAVVEAEESSAAAFFQRTVPTLDVSFVASHGRLLLARSRTRYHVCDPAANRWLVLPPPSALAPTANAASGLHYDVDDEATGGRVSFTVVLLARARGRRLRAETFSSATGRWVTTADVPGGQGAARRLGDGGGVASPGIYAGGSFHWLCRRAGHVVRYDAGRGRASVVRDPPEAAGSKGRAWRSLGSAGGLLRHCAFDILDEESGNQLPHDGLEGVHGVWVMDAAAAAGAPAAWRRVHEAVVEGLSTYYFHMLVGHEMALDFAGACGGSIVVDKGGHLLRYDLGSGNKVELASLYRDDGRLGALYRRRRVFPLFRSD